MLSINFISVNSRSQKIGSRLHPCNRDGTLSAQAPFRVCTLFQRCLACHPSASLSKDPQKPGCQAQPSVPESQKASCQGFPCFCQNCLPKSTNSSRVHGRYVVNRHTGGPLRMPPWSQAAQAPLSAAQWPCCQAGTHVLAVFLVIIAHYSSVQAPGSSRPRISSPASVHAAPALLLSAVCALNTASRRALSLGACKAVRKTHPAGPAAALATSSLRPGSADSPQGLFNATLTFRAICTRG